jgi:putative colanic acid biosynthesis acetyltransferase WcaF
VPLTSPRVWKERSSPLSQLTTDKSHPPLQDLANYQPDSGYSVGRSLAVVGLWTVAQALLVSSWVPGSWHRRIILRAFGAEIGRGVIIKPRTRIKFPWKLKVGDHSWLGEDVWIDNLAPVLIGDNACLSQGVYICTGSHDWRRTTFDLIVKPVQVGSEAWIAARAVVGPGAEIGTGAVLGLASVASGRLEPFGIYRGNPAIQVGTRLLK